MLNQQLLKVIKRYERYFDSEIRDIEKISSGYSNDIFCVWSQAKKYYLRITKINPLIDRGDEKKVFDILGMRCYFYEDKGNYIRDWYNADPILKWNRKKINLLIKQVSGIHNINSADIKHFDPLEYDSAFKKSVYFKTYSEIYYNLVKKHANQRLVVCHNDLNNNNILYAKGKLYLLDFERVQMNSKYWDWANFARERLTLKQINYLCDKCSLDLSVFKDFLIMTCIHALQWTTTVPKTADLTDYQTKILQRLKLFWVDLK